MTSYCSNCIHYKVCGNEGVDDSAMTFCADKQTDGDLISRQALLQKMWNDFYKMEDAHEKEQGFEYIGEKRTLEQNGFECAIKTVSEYTTLGEIATIKKNQDFRKKWRIC